MATEFSMLGIMNAALTARGWDEIVSENDGTPEFRAMARNWPLIVESELENGLYNFTRMEVTIQGRVDGKFGFADGYIIPNTALHVRKVKTLVGNDWREAQAWTQDGDHVYVNSTTGAKIEIMICADEAIWSANFCNAMNHAMQAVLINAFEGEPSEYRAAMGMADEFFQKARTISSKSRSAARPVRGGGIAAARFARGTT